MIARHTTSHRLNFRLLSIGLMGVLISATTDAVPCVADAVSHLLGTTASIASQAAGPRMVVLNAVFARAELRRAGLHAEATRQVNVADAPLDFLRWMMDCAFLTQDSVGLIAYRDLLSLSDWQSEGFRLSRCSVMLTGKYGAVWLPAHELNYLL